MRKIVSISILMLFYCLAVQAQSKISGTVRDQNGEPVPFATVTVKGTKVSVAADANANFSIPAQTGNILNVSAVGTQNAQVTVGNSPTVSVILTRIAGNITDVVVTTALGLQRTRNSLPYAAQQVSGEDLNKTVTTNVVDNLSGKVAGLEITSSNAMGGSTNAILRGFKSLTQSNQALFVIDGVPYDNTTRTGNGYDFGSAASDLNPEDIATISVLKGAAASALYGSRGSNGVILITTKRGYSRKGVGVTATFGVSAGSPDKSTLPTYQTAYGEGYAATMDGFVSESIPGVNNGNPVTIVGTSGDAATGPVYDPSLMVYNWDAFSPTNPNFHKATPWQPAANHNPTDYFVTPVTTTESVLVQGGSDKGTFKFNYTRDDEKGFIPNSSVNRNLIDLGATYNIVKNLTIEGGLNYVDESAINRYLYQYTATTNPMTDFRQWWPTNVNIQEQKNDFFNSRTNATWNWQDDGSYQNNKLGSIGLPAYHDNLYWFAYKNFEADSRTRYTGHVRANWAITNFLNLTGTVTDDHYNQLIEERNDIGSQNPSFYNRQNIGFDESNYNLILNFNKNFGDNFNIKALVGGNIQRDKIPSIFVSTNGGLLLPGYWSISNSVKTPNAPTETDLRKEIDGIFGGVTFTYKDMLTLDATIRRDKSSTLPSAHDVYYYPSISANYVFSKLLPQTNTWLSYGKIWVNYAQVGGDAPYYSVNNTYTINTPLNGQAVMNGTTTNNNANLIPEQNKTYEAGLEMSFLKNRIGFTADYYHSVQSNQILPVTVSRASGYNFFNVNGGAVQNQGVEATLNITPVKTRDFMWNITVNWSKNVNKVLSLYGGQPSFEIAGLQNGIQIVGEVGKPYGIIRGTDYVYKNGKRVIDNNGYYEQNPNTLSDIGNINPNWIGGINNSFTYKNFTLSFLIDIHQGGDVYSLDMDYGSFSGLYPRTAGLNDKGKSVRAPLSEGGGVILDGVTEDGKPNTTRIAEDLGTGSWTYGTLGAGAENNSQFVYDASFVKLREAALTYSLPAKVIQNIHFVQGISLSVSGRNLWIIHKNEPYADPEQGQAAGNASIGFQNGAYPTYKMYNFIIKVNF